MARAAVKKKDPAAVALGRRGGKKGGLARAAKLTPQERSESARKAVQSRWAKHESPEQIHDAGLDVVATDTSDRALLALLKRLRAASDPAEAGQLADRIERVIFHRQFGNA